VPPLIRRVTLTKSPVSHAALMFFHFQKPQATCSASAGVAARPGLFTRLMSMAAPTLL
jgi:hypothetical protein